MDTICGLLWRIKQWTGRMDLVGVRDDKNRILEDFVMLRTVIDNVDEFSIAVGSLCGGSIMLYQVEIEGNMPMPGQIESIMHHSARPAKWYAHVVEVDVKAPRSIRVSDTTTAWWVQGSTDVLKRARKGRYMVGHLIEIRE
jgi:hypothetical protein